MDLPVPAERALDAGLQFGIVGALAGGEQLAGRPEAEEIAPDPLLGEYCHEEGDQQHGPRQPAWRADPSEVRVASIHRALGNGAWDGIRPAWDLPGIGDAQGSLDGPANRPYLQEIAASS